MPTLQVHPRPTPEERDGRAVEVQVDEGLTVLSHTIEDWVAHRQNWEFTLHEGHDFGRSNTVEGRLLYVGGEHSSSLAFRLEQLERCDDVGGELVMIFEETDGIAKIARATANGLDVELHHILTFT